MAQLHFDVLWMVLVVVFVFISTQLKSTPNAEQKASTPKTSEEKRVEPTIPLGTSTPPSAKPEKPRTVVTTKNGVTWVDLGYTSAMNKVNLDVRTAECDTRRPIIVILFTVGVVFIIFVVSLWWFTT